MKGCTINVPNLQQLSEKKYVIKAKGALAFVIMLCDENCVFTVKKMWIISVAVKQINYHCLSPVRVRLKSSS